ncbi:hypothetical protein THAOC_10062 [Thalassiosira oceanica]|uniref:SHSP domain-containing protein n=1 Tax=Thalassiosira oceanica TaxID=159749 RepID=K0TDY3_THAOC|nr:hypothetical protein THAOC_10062 [Thalassiosira oceanica]|eukprot:EJK68732.1 hypothetical protein THAOC_10062 [Thalassiosira oceanica]
MSLSFYYPGSYHPESAFIFSDLENEAKRRRQNECGGPSPAKKHCQYTSKHLPLVKPSPHFQVSETTTHIQLALDLPGVKLEDIKAELVNGGRVLHLSGGRKVGAGSSFEEAKFEKRFSLGKDVDASKLTAHLADGVLTLTAPKSEPKAQEIAIVRGQAPELTMMETKQQEVTPPKKADETEDAQEKEDDKE